MFGQTQAVDFGQGSKTLVKINQDGYASEYYLRDSISEHRMKIRHSTVLHDAVPYARHNVEITRTVFATSTVPEYVQKAYFVFEHLPSDVDAVKPFDGLADWAIATADAALISLVGWES
jgi:hypothetical protein